MTAKRHLHTMSFTPRRHNSAKAHHIEPQVFSRGPHAVQDGYNQAEDKDGAEQIIAVPYSSYRVFGIMLKISHEDYYGAGDTITLKMLALGYFGAASTITVAENIAEFYELSANATAPNIADLATTSDATVSAWCSPDPGRSYAVDATGTLTKTDKIRMVNDRSSDGNGSDDIAYSLYFCDSLAPGRSDAGNYNKQNTPHDIGVGITWSNLYANPYAAGTFSEHILVQPWDGLVL